MRCTSVRFIAALAATLPLASLALADVFVLNDGRRIEGSLARETATTYVVKTGVGEVEIAKSDVKEIVKGKTAREEFDERYASAKSAEDFFQVGEWASAQKLRALARKAYDRALALDSQHEGANRAVGNVLYKGTWMTPEERDRRARADEEAEMLARGFVRFEDRWVTSDEKAKLEQGLVLHEGEWMSVPEANRAKGLEEFEGAWLPRPEALARGDVRAVEKLAACELELVVTSQAAIAGAYPAGVLTETGARLDQARAWFDRAYGVEPGLSLLGGRLAEFYLWSRDSSPFVGTVDHFASLTPTVGAGWAEAVKKTHGFFWIDPYALSSARVWNRPDADLVGHCVHHWGHMLLGRLGYDGRLLPPWYEEGVASATEFKVFGRNAVFCRASTTPGSDGTAAKKGAAVFAFDTGLFRSGQWREALRKALEAGAVPSFDVLAKKEFAELELIDIAAAMAIVAWLEEKGDGALAKFHRELRRTQPPSPERVVRESRDRQAAYDAAFKAACGLASWREADQAWRTWFAAR
jgi:hypothetical protein